MRGSIIKRSKRSWALVVDLGRNADGKRRQKWVKFAVPSGLSARDATKAAEAELAKVLAQIHENTFVEPSRMTLIGWLRAWLESTKLLRRPRTRVVYGSVIENIGRSSLAGVTLQKLEARHLERYYAEMKAAPATVALHHSVIRAALQKAVRSRLVPRNVALDGVERPKLSRDHVAAREHCWTAAEARRFLETAKEAEAQAAAFFALALDSGARRNELLGLTWNHVDLEAARITIARQLIDINGEARDGAPVFGPTKHGRARTVTLGAETVRHLREQRRQQAELKLRNRTTYEDHGLVFAKESRDLTTRTAKLGQPVGRDRMARVEYRRLVAAAGVKRIRFHGLRHTVATLLLQAGVPVRDVSDRLGHANASMTLNVYAHAMPDQQATVAERLGAILFG